jgi:hypothetical protein
MAFIARWTRCRGRCAHAPRRARFRVPTAVLVRFLAGWSFALTIANASAQQPSPAPTARNIRLDATQALPLDKLDDEMRTRVLTTVTKAGIFSRLPAQVIDCNPDIYAFLIRNPEVIVNIWHLMNVSKVTLQRTGPNMFDAADNAGSRSVIRYCYSNHDTHLVYAEGSYDGPLFNRQIRATCVLLIRSAAIRETDGHDYITCRMDAFINIENVGVDLLAKTFQPLVTKSMEYNFQETAAFVSMVSRTAERNPDGIGRLAAKMKATPLETREQFVQLAHAAADRAGERNVAPGKEVGALTRPGPATAAQRR